MSERYDIGFINDFGGGDTNWWADYLRAEVERANDFHADIHEQTDASIAALSAENERLRKALDEIANGPWFADKSYPVLFAHITAKAREALEAKP